MNRESVALPGTAVRRAQDLARYPIDMPTDKELLEEFLEEARCHLSDAEVQILSLEEEEIEEGTLDPVMACFHAIKGGASLLRLNDIEGCAHEVEGVLDALQRSGRRFSRDATAVMFQAVDFLRSRLDVLQDAHEQGDVNYRPSDEMEGLWLALRGAATGVALKTVRTKKDERAEAAEKSEESSESDGPVEPIINNMPREIRIDAERCRDLVDALRVFEHAGRPVVQHLLDAETLPEHLRNACVTLTDSLNKLQSLAHELFLAPMTPLCQKLQQAARQLAEQLGKRVSFIIEGAHIETKRVVAERLMEPLLQLLRNAFVHGIESSEERAIKGKPAEGRVVLRLAQVRDRLVIEFFDDGRGVDLDKVREMADAQCLLGYVDEESLSQLVFVPGFSTAAAIDEYSGRGIGLEVVKQAVEALHGTVDLFTKKDKGCNFRIEIPLK